LPGFHDCQFAYILETDKRLTKNTGVSSTDLKKEIIKQHHKAVKNKEKSNLTPRSPQTTKHNSVHTSAEPPSDTNTKWSNNPDNYQLNNPNKAFNRDSRSNSRSSRNESRSRSASRDYNKNPNSSRSASRDSNVKRDSSQPTTPNANPPQSFRQSRPKSRDPSQINNNPNSRGYIRDGRYTLHIQPTK
jgi:hypothetical protein